MKEENAMFEKIKDDILKTGVNVFRIALYQDGEWREETLRPVCPNLNCYSLSKKFHGDGHWYCLGHGPAVVG
jgi:hypothetical protein